MTDLKYKILEKLYNATYKELPKTDILNSELDTYINIDNALDELEYTHYVKFREMSSKYELTSIGTIQYESELAKNKQNRHNEIHRWINTLIGLAALIVSILQLVQK